MAQFMLLIRGDEEVERSAEEAQAVIREYMAWARKLRDENRMLGGDELDSRGKYVRMNDNGHQVLDGPYAETKEVIGGYFLIEADEESHAVEIAKACPGLKRGGVVEIRRIIDHSA